MSVAVRLHKVGKGAKKHFYYRISAVDTRKARDGKVIEDLGFYDPSQEKNNFKVNLERLEYWKSKGAKLSATITSLAKKAGR